MAISTSWYIPDRVVLYKVIGAMDANDIGEMERVMTSNMPVAGRAIHQMIDITDMTRPPTIGVLRQHARPASHDDGYFVVIGKVSRMSEFVITTLAQITNFRVIIVSSLEEAITKLRHQDPTL